MTDKAAKLAWAKKNIIAWMTIVRDWDGIITIQDNERPSEPFRHYTHEEFIKRIQDFYNEECVGDLISKTMWLDDKESYELHMEGVRLGLVTNDYADQLLLKEIRKAIYDN